MNIEQFDYKLPEELIAQTPLDDRTASRLMVVSRESGEISHKIFRDVIDYLDEDDLLILNNSRVIPARLFGIKKETNAKIEILLLNRKTVNQWEILAKPGKKVKTGTQISFGDGLLKGKIIEVKEDGNRIIEFSYDGIFEQVLDKLGEMPLPPYITEKLVDKERYQTVYSKEEGSAAAPTAGLHWTVELLARLREKGVKIGFVTLHVGLGTFRQVKVKSIEEHQMHSEYYELDEQTANLINETKAKGKKVIAVGTTSVRVVETSAKMKNYVEKSSGWTNIFIYPGYEFKIIDGLITNFHLPKSTLLMLISAFSNRDDILNAYKIAIEEKYRFFSFGDAMMIM